MKKQNNGAEKTQKKREGNGKRVKVVGVQTHSSREVTARARKNKRKKLITTEKEEGSLAAFPIIPIPTLARSPFTTPARTDRRMGMKRGEK